MIVYFLYYYILEGDLGALRMNIVSELTYQTSFLGIYVSVIYLHYFFMIFFKKRCLSNTI